MNAVLQYVLYVGILVAVHYLGICTRQPTHPFRTMAPAFRTNRTKSKMQTLIKPMA